MKEEQEKNKKTLEEQVENFLGGFEDRLKQEKEAGQALTEKLIDEKLEAAKKELETYVDRVRQNNVSLSGMEEQKEQDKFSFAKACHAIIHKNWKGAGYEKEVIDATMQKAATDTNLGSQGGFLIPTELASEKILMPAMANQIMVAAGMDVWNGLTADLDIPRFTTRPTLAWLTDGESLSTQNVTVGKLSLRPKEGGMLLPVSNRLLMQAPAEGKIRNLMIEGAALGMDAIQLNGTGSDSEPTGLLNSGISTSTAIGGGRMTVDNVATMIADVEDSDYGKSPNSLSFISKPRVISGLKRERVAQYSGDTSGQPLINPLMTNEVLKGVLGLKSIGGSTAVPVVGATTKTYAVVGEFQQFVCGIWGGVRLKSSAEAGTAFASNQTWIVMFVDMDCACLQPTAFRMISDAESAEASW